ncbi:MAG: hypothetical protein EBU93_07955, partial [Chlamydiae bacterium]|nr:hypothetical protein [Chlamydiota bacterium]
MSMILHSKPWITRNDINQVVKTLKSGMIGQGEIVEKFEKKFSTKFGHKIQGVAVGSGAGALYLSLVGLNCGPGSEVIFPTYSCRSLLDAVLSTGAKPVLCDISKNWIVEKSCITKKITKKTKVIIVPHIYGVFANTKEIASIGIPVIEDCAQAISVKNKQNGTLAIYSFHPTKILTCGEGGMVIANEKKISQILRILRDGDPNLKNQRKLFSPLSDLQASLGLAQLKNWNLILQKRLNLVMEYKKYLIQDFKQDFDFLEKNDSMFFRLPLKVNGGAIKYTEDFKRKNIIVRKGINLLLHRLMRMKDDLFPNAVHAFNNT